MHGFGDDESRAQPLPLWEVVRTAHLVERVFVAAFARAGLTPQEFGVLASLADEPELTRAQVARNVMVRPQSIGRIIDRMVRTGLLSQAHPGGRGRAAPLTITAEGRARLEAAWPLVAEINAPPATGLGPEQARLLCGLLATVREQVSDDPAR